MIKVRVPATSANMGAGFDTLGIALNLYNRLKIETIPSGLEIYAKNAEGYIPSNENNLIYRAMKALFDYIGFEYTGGIRIVQDSQIPMTRGLGSSSACIVGGMLAANIIAGRKLSYNEIIHLASQMEGHPDNAGPALFGGFCVSAMDKERTIVKSYKLTYPVKFAVMIPDFFVATKKSRGTLPDMVSREDAVFNINRASMFQAAMASGDTELLRFSVEDRLHQQYRKSYVDGMDEIFEKTYSLGALATYLSGSGPTILSVLDNNGLKFCSAMRRFFKENEHKWSCKLLSADNVGAVVSVTENSDKFRFTNGNIINGR